MTALVWGIKGSLLRYVEAMADGSVDATDGATSNPDGFVFPAVPDQPLAFTGCVTLTAHGGMMRVRLAAPALVRGDAGWVLEIADPDDASVRLTFATLASFDGEAATGTALTADGADLFFGPYREGTPLADPVVRDTSG